MDHRLHLGANVPGTRFSVSVDEVEDFLDEFPELTDYSLIIVRGKFESDRERSYRLEIFGFPYELVERIALAYKETFRQKVVGYERIITNYREL